MKRLLALIFVLLLGFYVAWPGWSGYQIANALKAKDAPALERKIVFEDVRMSLRPAAIQKVGEFYDRAQQNPLGAAIAGNIKKDVAPAIADAALKSLVTAPNLIRVVHDGRSLKESAERILTEQVGKIGLPGLGGGGSVGPGGGAIQLPGGIKLPGGLADRIPGLGGLGGAPKQEPAPATAPQPAPATAETPPNYGLSNIKRFSFLGPLAFEVGVAKDAKATEPDVTVEMRFLNGDWRVVGVKPRI